MRDPIPEAILDGIAEVAREHLQYMGALPLEARLVEDLELDSIQLLTLAVEVENRFDICLDDDEDDISTVSDLAVTVARKVAENAHKPTEGGGTPG